MFGDISKMFGDIPRNVWRHSPEYNIPPIPRVPRIPFPVPVFLVLYIALQLVLCVFVLFFLMNTKRKILIRMAATRKSYSKEKKLELIQWHHANGKIVN